MQLMLIAAKNRTEGTDLLERLDEARSDGLIELDDLAMVYQNDKGKVKIQQTSDAGFGKGAVRGGAIGLIVGIVAAPAVLPATAVGAAAGGIIAKIRDAGVDNPMMKSLGGHLEGGETVVCALGDESAISLMVNRAGAEGVEYLVLPAETQDALNELAKLPPDLVW